MTHNLDTPANPLSRRAVVGAAWTVPAIAVAVAAPLAAASTTAPVITPAGGLHVTTWRGDHHYGSAAKSPTERSYPYTVTVTDKNGLPVKNTAVIISGNSTLNKDGHLVWFYAGTAPSKAPNLQPDATQPAVSAITNGSGIATFAVNTQNLSKHEIPASGTFTVSVTTAGGTSSQSISYTMSATD